MEWHQQHRTASISRALHLHHSGRRAHADQEDGTAEIELPFSQHQAPHSWGFLFVGGWVAIQSPANVVPNSPTASSAQIRKNIITIIKINTFQYL